jgi:hypothetical protein
MRKLHGGFAKFCTVVHLPTALLAFFRLSASVWMGLAKNFTRQCAVAHLRMCFHSSQQVTRLALAWKVRLSENPTGQLAWQLRRRPLCAFATCHLTLLVPNGLYKGGLVGKPLRACSIGALLKKLQFSCCPATPSSDRPDRGLLAGLRSSRRAASYSCRRTTRRGGRKPALTSPLHGARAPSHSMRRTWNARSAGALGPHPPELRLRRLLRPRNPLWRRLRPWIPRLVAPRLMGARARTRLLPCPALTSLAHAPSFAPARKRRPRLAPAPRRHRPPAISRRRSWSPGL